MTRVAARRSVAWLTGIVCGLGMGGIAASPAQAVFPGRDGLLVVAPVAGPGLLLVNPRDGAVRGVCADVLLCGRPAGPRWSPDGRAIVFDDPVSSRVGIVSSRGTCLWCLPGPALPTVGATSPAFMARGHAISVIGGHRTRRGVWRTILGGTHASRILKGRFTDAVWSSTGMLAVVRDGSVWLRGARAGALRALARGTSPSWSPDGSRLALARGGWIWIVRVRDGAARRLVRGASPAWSPDGAEIAYIGPQRLLPRPRARPCALPKGAKVLARSADAVVATGRSTADFRVYGCLRIRGMVRSLTSQINDDGATSVGSVALGGRFAAVSFYSCGKSVGCDSYLQVFDLSSGKGLSSFDAGNLQYPIPTAAGIDSLAVDSSGFSAWRVTGTVATHEPLTGVSCPSATSCVAVDSAGNVATTTNPTGGRSAWTLARIDDNAHFAGVSCATTLCVAPDSYAGDVLTTTAPGGGARAWVRAHIDDAHSPLERTFPAALDGVACPSASLCVVVDDAGNVLTSTDPTGGAGTWRSRPVDSAGYRFGAFPGRPGDVSCPSVSLCVAVDTAGNLLTSTDPTGGTGAWSTADIDQHRLSGVSCPSASLCVAFDTLGNVHASSDPTGGAGSWRTANLEGGFAGYYSLADVSCPSVSLCVAVDTAGNVLTSTDPTGGTVAWRSTLVDAPACAPSTPCRTERLYVHADHRIRVVDRAPPGLGKSIADVRLSGNGLTLTWTHDGTRRQLGLR